MRIAIKWWRVRMEKRNGLPNCLRNPKFGPERVTRDRLYFESLESVLSKSAKVMVDVKGG
ncbi:MAG: hypothetical protein CM1200mP9_02710 [Gammaproteobacteria bacterium]|nr:MAG: hypothetical protein CM1200mP9_02710 [Gammaproteobacteria bacterium]